MKWLNGWTVALGTLGVAALYNARRSGEMTEERDRAYRECLTGRVPTDRMRAVANEFEKARCYPQSAMLRKRIALKELPPEEQDAQRQAFEKGMASKNGPGVLRLAAAFEYRGATSSAAKLRRHAAELARASAPESRPVVPPPPPDAIPSERESGIPVEVEVVPDSERTEPTEPAIPIPQHSVRPSDSDNHMNGTPTNGKSHVAISIEAGPTLFG